MLRHLTLSALSALAALPALEAQPNPFKIPKVGIRGAAITYAMTGDMTGTATVGFDGERYLRATKSTMKIMGKSTSVEDWTLTTADSMWRADLIKKEGTVSPNLLPVMAKAYDGLDGDGKKRFHQNVSEMGALLGRALGFGNLNAGEKLGTKTYAGQECEERRLGDFTICQMTRAPIVLHTAGNLVCISFAETATEVTLAPPPAGAFAPPAGVVFQPDPYVRSADSLARGFVGYFASQELSDSLAKAKAAIASDTTKARELTPEEREAARQACETLMSLDMNKVMADASKAFQRAMVEAAKNEAKNQAVKGIKGLLKKPKIP